MGNRNIERSVARKLYGRFCHQWRDHMRATGMYGKPNAAKRPRFSQWFAVHDRDVQLLQEATPVDYLDFLAAAQGQDPWAEPEAQASSEEGSTEDRGVLTIDMQTGEETKS